MIPAGVYHEMALLEPGELRFLGQEFGRMGKRKAWRALTGRRNGLLQQITNGTRRALGFRYARTRKTRDTWELFGKANGRIVLVLRVLSPPPRRWADAASPLRVELIRPDLLVHPDKVYKVLGWPGVEAKKAGKACWPSPLHPFL
jgi:hypothetical protein